MTGNGKRTPPPALAQLVAPGAGPGGGGGDRGRPGAVPARHGAQRDAREADGDEPWERAALAEGVGLEAPTPWGDPLPWGNADDRAQTDR